MPAQIEMKVQALISSLKFWDDCVLVQYWVPRRFISSGKVMPSVFQQPFGVKGLRNGLCKYRLYCTNHMFKSRDLSDLGPPGRVFMTGSPEICDDIGRYSIEEFPLRDLAISCGIKSCLVFPLFQRIDNQQQRCVGVLEFLSFQYTRPNRLENKDFACTSSSHFPECKKMHFSFVSSHHYTLQFLKTIPTAPYHGKQFWVPCTCENGNSSSKITQLFCQLPRFHWDTKYSLELSQIDFNNQTYFVKTGKSWIGMACLLNKVCFFSDTSRLSLTDYPLVHLVRSNSAVSSCFAIPLQLIHPKLPPLILEAFITQSVVSESSLEESLNELLTKMAKGLSKHNVAFELKNKEKFFVEFSHKDDENYVFFDVYRRESSKTKKQTELQMLLDAIRNGQNPKTLERGTGSSFSDDEAEITLDKIRNHFGRNIDDAAKDLRVSRSTLKRRCRTLGIKRWPSHKRFNRANDHIGRTSAKILDKEGDSSEFDQESMAAGARDAPAAMDSIPMTMSATYKDDVVKFTFPIGSGIEELRFALVKRFTLGTDENFKIKFGDEGHWILISCDEDLHFHMTRMKSLGQTVMNLLVVLASDFFMKM